MCNKQQKLRSVRMFRIEIVFTYMQYNIYESTFYAAVARAFTFLSRSLGYHGCTNNISQLISNGSYSGSATLCLFPMSRHLFYWVSNHHNHTSTEIFAIDGVDKHLLNIVFASWLLLRFTNFTSAVNEIAIRNAMRFLTRSCLTRITNVLTALETSVCTQNTIKISSGIRN